MDWVIGDSKLTGDIVIYRSAKMAGNLLQHPSSDGQVGDRGFPTIIVNRIKLDHQLPDHRFSSCFSVFMLFNSVFSGFYHFM